MMKYLSSVVLIILFTFKIIGQNSDTFTDSRDGKIYKTHKIGDNIWMVQNLSYKSPKGCWAYAQISNNVKRHGFLYNWEAAKNACPSGWHLPSKDDFEQLLNDVGTSKTEAFINLLKGSSSGFYVQFSGFRGDFTFGGIDMICNLWSSSEINEKNAWYLAISGYTKTAEMHNLDKNSGYSVRCIKDK